MRTALPLILGFEGTILTQPWIKHLANIKPMGLILFRRNLKDAEQIRQLTNELRDLLGPVVISIDQEGGSVSRLDLVKIPAPARVGKIADWAEVEAIIRLQAETLADLGIDLNLAPVLDIDSAGENPALTDRSFSDDPERVARYAAAMIRLHEEYGVGTCGKHFPGFGACRFDPHTAMGICEAAEDDRQKALFPFAQAIRSGIPAIMSTHAIFPFDDRENIATFSRQVLHHLLRGELGFAGLILTDCVEMAGRGDWSPGEIAEKSLRAGNDLIISAFTLVGEMAFQQALADRIRHLRETDDNMAFHLAQTEQRLKAYRERFPIEPAASK